MTKLELYSLADRHRKDALKAALRQSTNLVIGPTARGGIFMQYKHRDINTDMSINEIKEIRDLLTDFLVNVCGEEV